MKTMKEVLNKIKELGWNVDECYDCYELESYSPKGQDFHITVDKNDDIKYFIGNIYKAYTDFDVSYQAYLWLDETGHGICGAPYDMKEVYEDMKWCEDAIYDLYETLKYWLDNLDKPLKLFCIEVFDEDEDGNSYVQYIASRTEERAEKLLLKVANEHYYRYEYDFHEVDKEDYEELYEDYDFKEDVIYDKK